MPCFGVAGNFTGHLEQAGELKDFLKVKTLDAKAPKALFPTYIPKAKGIIPSFLSVYPFDETKINFPSGEEKLQIEPECGIVFEVEWGDDIVKSLKPVCFGASNDCSIRKEGAKKISEKKNWGSCSKGFSGNLIPLDSFTPESIIKDYSIASFLLRDGILHDYGENSPVNGYNYVYEQLLQWIIDRLNNQKDEGPAECLHDYLTQKEMNRFGFIFVSIGATRYTEYGEYNFLTTGDEAIVVLYPVNKYSYDDIKKIVLDKQSFEDISILRQKIFQ